MIRERFVSFVVMLNFVIASAGLMTIWELPIKHILIAVVAIVIMGLISYFLGNLDGSIKTLRSEFARISRILDND